MTPETVAQRASQQRCWHVPRHAPARLVGLAGSRSRRASRSLSVDLRVSGPVLFPVLGGRSLIGRDIVGDCTFSRASYEASFSLSLRAGCALTLAVRGTPLTAPPRDARCRLARSRLASPGRTPLAPPTRGRAERTRRTRRPRSARRRLRCPPPGRGRWGLARPGGG